MCAWPSRAPTGDGDERPDDELVVPVLALEPQRRLVAVDAEDVLARPAEHGRRVGDAVAEPGDSLDAVAVEQGSVDRGVDRVDLRLGEGLADRVEDRRAVGDDDADDHRRGGELVSGRDPARGRGEQPGDVGARRVEDLPDLEAVVARASVERRDRAVVVDDEAVVAAEAADRQTAVDRLRVVDALDAVVRADAGDVVGVVDQSDEVVPDEEEVVGMIGEPGHDVGALDHERVDAVVRRSLVDDVDDGVAGVREMDGVGVCAAAAEEVEHGVDAVLVRPDEGPGAGCGRRDVDTERVVALLPVERREAGDRVHPDLVVDLVHRLGAAARVQLGRGGVRRVDEEAVACAAEPDVQVLEAAVRDPGRRHVEARDRGRGQDAVVARRVAGVVHVQSVGAASRLSRADHDERRLDPVDVAADVPDRVGRGRQAAHVDGVRAASPSTVVTPAIDRTATRSPPSPVFRSVVPACVLTIVKVSAADPSQMFRCSNPLYVIPAGAICSPVSVVEVSVPSFASDSPDSSTFRTSLPDVGAEPSTMSAAWIPSTLPPTLPRVRRRGEAADVDGVRAVLGVDRGRARDRLHRDTVVAGARLERGGRRVRAQDREVVRRRSEPDVERPRSSCR